MGAPNTLGNTKAYDDEQALLAAERRGYLRGVEDERARIVAHLESQIAEARDLGQPDAVFWTVQIKRDIRALGAKPMTNEQMLRDALERCHRQLIHVFRAPECTGQLSWIDCTAEAITHGTEVLAATRDDKPA